MKEIPLTRGKHAIVDDEDYVFLDRFSWQCILSPDGTESVSTNFKLQNGRWVSIPMNRFLYKPKIQHKVAYKNKNPLDNRKENLVLLTTSEFNGTAWKMYAREKKHMIGKRKKRNLTSEYKGVHYSCDSRYKKRWIGAIHSNGKAITKHFLTEIEAALWYNDMAKKLFGAHSYQNKI